MKDRQQDIAKTSQWAVEQIAKSMGQEPKTITLFSNGTAVEGIEFGSSHWPEGNNIQLFPETSEVHIHAANVSLYAQNVRFARASRNGIHFETTDDAVRGVFLKDGHIAVEVFPHPAGTPLESPTGIPQPQDAEIIVSEVNASPSASSDEIRPSAESSAPSETGSRRRQVPTAHEALQLPPAERQPRVRWEGYVTYQPNFATGKDEKVRVNMTVSEKIQTAEGEKSVYHRVFTTGREAERLMKEGISTGWKVKVDGYLQNARTKRTKDGAEVPDPRFYANHVSILRRKDTQPAQNEPKTAE